MRQNLRVSALALVVICAGFPVLSLAGTTYCVSTNGASHYPYATWDDAATNIQMAVDVATNDGDIVQITNGVYTGSGAYVVSVTNLAGRTLTIQGMGAGQTIIDGQGARVGLFLDGSTTNVMVEKLSITRGFRAGTGTATTYGGAGILMSNGTVRLCTILNNANITNGAGYANGGGVFIAGGLLSQCSIVSNTASMTATRQARGAGVCMSGGTVEHCMIAGNDLVSGAGNPCLGGGVYVGGGTLRNCIVVRNTAAPATGEMQTLDACAGVYVTGIGKVQHCTIARNSMLAGHGVGLLMANGSVTNTIVYHNVLTQNAGDVFPVQQNVYMTGGSFVYSCATPLMPGTNNIAADPLFADAVADDYRLLPGSPCIDAGSNITAAVTTDYDGNPRFQDGDGDGVARYDMGAYEAEPLNLGSLRCGFAASTNAALDCLDAVLSATVAGAETNELTYWWDFTGDGTNDLGGASLATVTNAYGYGAFPVRLTVSNTLNQTASCLRETYIRVAPSVLYVAADSNSDTAPYDTPAKASSNIQSALNWALSLESTGSVVLVTNGTYRLAEQILLSKGVTLRGLGGAAGTSLVQTNTRGRVLYVSDAAANAIVEGFTVTGGKESTASPCYGAGVRMHAGTIRACTFSNNVNFTRFADGGGVYMAGGALLDCRVAHNLARGTYNGEGFGGGIYVDAGRIERCVIVSNTITTTINASSYGDLYGAGIYMAKGVLQNTLIAGNAATNGDPSSITKARGGGLYLASGATALNCTVADNSLTPIGTGGGCYVSGGAVTNAIVYFNLVGAGADNMVTNGGSVGYSCSTPAMAGAGNIGDDPQFAGRVNGNYRLSSGSPCVDKGTNLVAVTNDLDGAVRPQQGKTALIHDMGAYEASAPAATFELLLSGAPLEGVAPYDVIFSATVSGAHTNSVYYQWDFDGNGSADAAGTGLSVITNTYHEAGRFSVAVTASNEAAEVTNVFQSAYVHVAAPIIYVATNGSHSLPFGTPGTAASNLQAAIDEAVVSTAATSLVQVLPGTYEVSQEVAVNKGITVLGSGGAERTIVRRSPPVTFSRIVLVNHAAAVIDGLTLRDGLSNVLGMDGLGVYLVNGTVQNCIIVSNASTARGATGGGVRIQNGLLRNCLVAGNEASANSYNDAAMGGGVYLQNGRIENCTVTGNRANAASTNAYGGGVYRTGGSITNCIIYGNTAKTANNDLYGVSSVGFSCSSDLTHDPLGSGNLTNDPAFLNPGAGYGLSHVPGDYHLKSGSKCLNAGTNWTWMIGATDLAGSRRISGFRVDMGAYERPPPVGTVVVLQ
jgi:hypothetical protein